MNNRKLFKFYRSYFDVLQPLSKDDQLEFLLALLNKQFLGIEPELTGDARITYFGQKYSIDKQIEGWENKTKTQLTSPTQDPTLPPTQDPTLPPNQPPTTPPTLQVKEEVKEEVKVEVKEQVKEKAKIAIKKLSNEDKSTINYIMDISGVSYEEAVSLYLKQQDEIFSKYDR